ncbi:hypothetical protein [Nitrosovibrio tenuis]|uniref:Uncharacterized protein n=1 Tax=Nitrosovibrio tenuis TaxID=1233 RepID=A0A1H7IVS0_9PROT|nr:hypothetical protein [Nitrosovibrio tenuis]SEK64875.1 hypothetical protein SAMN05216387_102270 [Nitrosovibrio tenuis]
MFNFGAFAGGLAQGIRSGQDMQTRQNTAGRLARADDREAEIHQAKMDKADIVKGKRERLSAANEEIVAGWSQTRQPRPGAAVDSNKPGLTRSVVRPAKTMPQAISEAGGPEPQGFTTLENTTAVDEATPGLMSQYGVSRLSNTPAVQGITADETIGRRMLTGNLLDDADELTRMATIYKKHGLLAEMMPWLNKAYDAKKKRIPDALHLLLTGDAKGARDALRKGGINLAEDPVPVDQSDPLSNNWRFRFENGTEKTINLKDLAAQFLPSTLR